MNSLERIISSYIQIHTNPQNLVLLLNTNELELECFKNELESASQLASFDVDTERIELSDMKVINNETPAKERFPGLIE